MLSYYSRPSDNTGALCVLHEVYGRPYIFVAPSCITAHRRRHGPRLWCFDTPELPCRAWQRHGAGLADLRFASHHPASHRFTSARPSPRTALPTAMCYHGFDQIPRATRPRVVERRPGLRAAQARVVGELRGSGGQRPLGQRTQGGGGEVGCPPPAIWCLTGAKKYNYDTQRHHTQRLLSAGSRQASCLPCIYLGIDTVRKSGVQFKVPVPGCFYFSFLLAACRPVDRSAQPARKPWEQ